MTIKDLDKSTLAPQTRQGKSGVIPKRPIPTLLVLYHPDLNRVGDRYFAGELLAGRELALSRTNPDFFSLEKGTCRPLADPFLSRKPLRICPQGDGSLILKTERSSLEVDSQPVLRPLHINSARIRAGVVLLVAERIVLWLQIRPRPREEPRTRHGLIGESAVLLEALARLEMAADLDIPVLIRGETGTGKELFAGAVHRASSRRRKPLLSVNMAAVSPELAASELFGSREGAFTGARSRPGFFQRACGGTLFLDEIGETPANVQPMLLRALENREIIPVGETLPVRINARLVFATDTSLECAVAEGRFNAPLFHRLSGFVLSLPPLSARREDIGLLIRHFLRLETIRAACQDRLILASPDARPWFPARSVASMVRYHWSGNVRELANTVRQLVIVGRNRDYIPEDEWQPNSTSAVVSEIKTDESSVREMRKPKEITSEELHHALRVCHYELSTTAERLNLPRTSLYGMIRRSKDLRMASELSPGEIRAAYEQCDGVLSRMVHDLKVSSTALRRRLIGLGLQPQDKVTR